MLKKMQVWGGLGILCMQLSGKEEQQKKRKTLSLCLGYNGKRWTRLVVNFPGLLRLKRMEFLNTLVLSGFFALHQRLQAFSKVSLADDTQDNSSQGDE
jgi:hypothetical protein